MNNIRKKNSLTRFYNKVNRIYNVIEFVFEMKISKKIKVKIKEILLINAKTTNKKKYSKLYIVFERKIFLEIFVESIDKKTILSKINISTNFIKITIKNKSIQNNIQKIFFVKKNSILFTKRKRLTLSKNHLTLSNDFNIESIKLKIKIKSRKYILKFDKKKIHSKKIDHVFSIERKSTQKLMKIIKTIKTSQLLNLITRVI